MPLFSYLFAIVVTLVSCTPNFVVFIADDFGYGDLSSYGHPSQEHGPIDELAREGVRFTSCYSAHSMCTPSRAALLTGRLPVRYGLVGGIHGVFSPHHSTGLPQSEVTIAEALKEVGYTSGIVGKWHLGINKYNYSDGSHLPHSQGFDYVGTILPFSLTADCGEESYYANKPSTHRCFLYKNRTIVQQPIILGDLTDNILQDAVDFIKQNRNQPFFLYYAFPQTHNPMIYSSRFRNSSRRGIYGDQVQEMQWGVDEVMRIIKSLGMDDNTVVMFLSDHGSHLELCQEGGTAGMFKGGKGTFYDGGLRVPFIMRWPGHIKSGQVCNDMVSTMDIYSTVLHLAGAKVPNRTIDGKVLKILDDNSEGHDVLFFYCNYKLVAVRYKQYKVYHWLSPTVPRNYSHHNCPNGRPVNHFKYFALHCEGLIWAQPPIIFNVDQDPSEEFPLPIGQRHDAIINEVTRLAKINFSTIDTSVPELLVENLRHMSLFPCCNAPYCCCNKIKSFSYI